MRKAIKIAVPILLLIAALLGLIFIPRDITVVIYPPDTSHKHTIVFDVNPLLKIKIPSVRVTEHDISHIENSQRYPFDAYDYVKEHDNDVYFGQYNSIFACVREIDDHIYYYRITDVENIYKISKTTGEITAVPMSDCNNLNNTDIRKGFTEVDHNLLKHVNITTEALADSYPGFEDAVNSIDGEFDCHSSYYVDGRIFFIKNNTLYEYFPETGKAKKTLYLGKGSLELITINGK